MRTKLLYYLLFVILVIGATRALPQEANEDRAVDDTALKAMPDDFYDAMIASDPSNADLLRLRFNLYIAKGYFEKALSDASKAISIEPGNSLNYCARGSVHLMMETYGEAVNDFDKAIEMGPINCVYFLRRGAALNEIGRLDEALNDLNVAVLLDSQFAEHFRMRGTIHGNLREWSAAISDFDRALELAPQDDSRTLESRAEVFCEIGKPEDALADLEKAILLSPKVASLYVTRGFVLLSKGEVEKALSDCDKAFEIDGRLSRAFRLRGRIRRAKGAYEESLADLDRSISLDPKEVENYIDRAITENAMGKVDEASHDMDDAVRLRPSDYFMVFRRARFHGLAGRRETALADFEKAIQLNPQFIQAYLQKGQLLSQMGEHGRAVDCLNEVLSIDENNALAYSYLGTIRGTLREYERAIKALDRAIELNPKSVVCHRNRGLVWASLGDMDKAINDLTVAIRLTPGEPRSYRILARWLATFDNAKVRDAKRAVELATKACELTRWENSESVETLAMALAESGEFDEAQRHLQQAIDLDPGENVESRARLMALFIANVPYRDTSQVPTTAKAPSHVARDPIRMLEAPILTVKVPSHVANLDENASGIDCDYETSIFNAKVAATVNGVPILNGLVLDRHAVHLLAIRQEMQKGDKSLREQSSKQTSQAINGVESYKEYRVGLVRMTIDEQIQKTVVVQQYMASLSSEQLDATNQRMDKLFEKELGNLKRKLKVSDMSQLEWKLRELATTLENVKQNVVLDRLFKECIAAKSRASILIEDSEILDYYESHHSGFENGGIVKWDQISIHDSPLLSDEEARDKLERVLLELKQGASFKEIARKYQVDTTFSFRSWNGLRIDDLHDARLGGRLFASPLNEWSPVIVEQSISVVMGSTIKGREGVCTFRVTHQYEVRHKPFEDVCEDIRETLMETRKTIRREEIINEAMANAKITYSLPAIVAEE